MMQAANIVPVTQQAAPGPATATQTVPPAAAASWQDALAQAQEQPNQDVAVPARPPAVAAKDAAPKDKPRPAGQAAGTAPVPDAVAAEHAHLPPGRKPSSLAAAPPAWLQEKKTLPLAAATPQIPATPPAVSKPPGTAQAGTGQPVSTVAARPAATIPAATQAALTAPSALPDGQADGSGPALPDPSTPILPGRAALPAAPAVPRAGTTTILPASLSAIAAAAAPAAPSAGPNVPVALTTATAPGAALTGHARGTAAHAPAASFALAGVAKASLAAPGENTGVPRAGSAAPVQSISAAALHAPVLAAAIAPAPQPAAAPQPVAAAILGAAPLTPPSAAGLAAAVTAMHQAGQNGALLRLDPPGLGDLSVHVALGQSGQVNVLFIPSSQAASSVLQNNLSGLGSALAQSGLTLGQAQVGGQFNGQFNQNAGQGAYQPPAAPVFVPPATSLETEGPAQGGVSAYA